MRKEDWPELLNQYLFGEDHKFNWPYHNCGLFAGKWVCIATGQDFYSKFLPKRVGRLDAVGANPALSAAAGAGHAYRRLKKHGGSLATVATDALGTWRSSMLAQRGDIVLGYAGGRECLGVCNGEFSYFLAEHKGLVKFYTSVCPKSWRV